MWIASAESLWSGYRGKHQVTVEETRRWFACALSVIVVLVEARATRLNDDSDGQMAERMNE